MRRLALQFLRFLVWITFPLGVVTGGTQVQSLSSAVMLDWTNTHPDPLDAQHLPTFNTQDTLPPYITVLDSLLAAYYPDCGPNDYLSISRKPDGYYVGLVREGENYPQEDFPYWLQGGSTPSLLPFRARTAQDVLPHYGTESIGVWRERQFKRHLYFGYPGFTTASIAALEERPQLSIPAQKQLARAHAEHAMNLLSNQFGTAAREHQFPLDEAAYESLSPQQLTTYLYHQGRAIELYQKLPPATPTPVGDAVAKHGNEVLTAYLTLIQFGHPSIAKEQVAQAGDLYDPHLLLLAELTLESCPQNAVLITEGDNDTYPLIYLQLKRKLRPDVLVVNRHLLHLPRYVQAIRQGLQVGGALPLSSEESVVRSWQAQGYLPGPRQVLLKPDQVLSALADLESLEQAPEDLVPRLSFGAIQLSPEIDGPLFRPEANFFRTGELVILDLIATNYRIRPIAVSSTINQDYFAYSNSWQQIGLVYNLGDEKPGYHIDLPGTLAWSALMYRNSPIDSFGVQSEFLLDRLENIVIAASRSLRSIEEYQVANNLMDRYLSHLHRSQIFRRLHAISLLAEMHELGYDPATLTAYVGMMMEEIRRTPIHQRDEQQRRVLYRLENYLREGNFYTTRLSLPGN